MIKYALLVIVVGFCAGRTGGRLAVLPIIDTQSYASRYVRPPQHPEPLWRDPKAAEPSNVPDPWCDAQARQFAIYERNLLRGQGEKDTCAQ